MAQQSKSVRSSPLFGVAASLIIVLVGALLATWIQTGAGAAQVKEVMYLGADNGINDAYIWIPNGVTAKNPAPGILAVSGFNNSKEYMSNTALELARRGFVVLDIDMEAHGHSDPVSPGDGAFGALDGLNYLRSLPIVDKNNVGEVGMSLGGIAIDLAAAADPGDVKSLYFMDSNCVATCTATIDEGWSVGTGTEFANKTAGGAPGVTTGDQVKSSAFAEKWAGITSPLVPGQLYGSVAAGTAREYWEHFGDHAFSTDDPASIGDVISWFGLTLGGSTASGQIWPLKELGTGLGFLGLVLFLFTLGAWLLRSKFFESLNESLPAYKGNTGRNWWIFAVITALLGPVTFNWAFDTAFNANWGYWESVSTGFTFWLAVLGVITIVILTAGYYALARPAGASLVSYGLTWEGVGLDWRKIGKSALLALSVVAAGYFVLWVADSWMHIDFRVWVLTLKTSDLQHFPLMVAYAIPIALYFIPISVVLHGTLRPKNGEATLRREMGTNILILLLGAVGLLVWYYVPGEWFGAALNADIGLGMINFIGLLALLPIVAGLMTFFFRKTGHVYVGAFMCTFFITWYLTAAMTLLSIG
jgi:hypothetical protein